MTSRNRWPAGRDPRDGPATRAGRGFTDYGADDPERSGGYGRYGEDRSFGDNAYRGEGHGGGYGLAAEHDSDGLYGGASLRGSSAFGSPSAPDHRGRGPMNYTRSDARIAEDVNDRLTEDPWVDARQIEVTVSGAEITLAGKVDSRQARRRAEDIAEQVSGVRHVQNNLRVGSNDEAADGA